MRKQILFLWLVCLGQALILFLGNGCAVYNGLIGHPLHVLHEQHEYNERQEHGGK